MTTKKKLRIVIKIGSNLITENGNILNYKLIENLCDQISVIRKESTSGDYCFLRCSCSR